MTSSIAATAEAAGPASKHFAAVVATLPDMTGKTFAVTGCTSGTGLVFARTVGRLGARILMLNRPSPRADAALAGLQAAGIDAVPVACDLQSFASVRAAATGVARAAPGGIDVLCNNAGVMALPDEATADGFDVQMQSNHLSHFLLTSALWPLLEAAAKAHGEARIVNHSSGARRGPALDATYLSAKGGHLGGDGFPGLGKWKRYQQSKLANLLFTYALHDAIAREQPALKTRIKSLCAHPGPTASGLQAKAAAAGGVRLLDRLILGRTLRAAHSVEDGTLGILRASCEEEVTSGSFYGPQGAGRSGPAVLLPPERNRPAEAILWAASLKATGLARFF